MFGDHGRGYRTPSIRVHPCSSVVKPTKSARNSRIQGDGHPSFHFTNQPVQSCVDRFFADLSYPLVSNRSNVIDNIHRWRGRQIPLTVDGLVTRERPPIELFLGHDLFELFRIVGP